MDNEEFGDELDLDEFAGEFQRALHKFAVRMVKQVLREDIVSIDLENVAGGYVD